MTAVPSEFTMDTGERTPETSGLPRRAMVFLALVRIATVAAAAIPVVRAEPPHERLVDVLRRSAQPPRRRSSSWRAPARGARATTRRSSSSSPACSSCRPGSWRSSGSSQHIPEWLKMRYPWYIQTLQHRELHGRLPGRVVRGAPDPQLVQQLADPQKWALAGVVASVVFVLTNHILLAAMMRLAERTPIRKSDLFTLREPLDGSDPRLPRRGARDDLARQPLADRAARVAPLILIHRSLNVPALEEEARVDSKTGLFNARHFAAELRDELARAERFDRPMSVIMVDLDLLREINNTYGHLAGDAVLRGIAETFRGVLRDYDVPSRFGGEEFAILLPETTPEEAFEIAERIRRTVAATAFEVETSSEPIRRDDLPRRRRLSEGRDGRQRADPPGRPRGLPREAPGAQPRPRRELRAAARPRRPVRATRDRSGRGRGRSRTRVAIGHAVARRPSRKATRSRLRATVRSARASSRSRRS